MRGKKRITAALLAFCISFCIFPRTESFAAEKKPSVEERAVLAFEFLSAVGVLPKAEESVSFDSEKTLSRSIFAEAMVKACGGEETAVTDNLFSDVTKEHPQAGYIATAVQMGLMNGIGDGTFLPDYPVKYEEAVKVCVEALGYGTRAKLKGGYPHGYISVAGSLSMTEDVSAKINTFITLGNFALLLTNTLNTEILEISSVSKKGADFDTLSDKTMLKAFLGIERTEDKVTQTERSALTGVTNLGKGEAIIGERFYKSAGSNVADFLGYYVTAYYKNDNELLFVWPKSHEMLTVSADNIIKDDASFCATCFVWEDSRGKTRQADISPYADLIYNGVSVGGFGKDNMIPKNGTVELLDNNGDRLYDVIFVNEYRDMVAGEPDKLTKTVNDKEVTSNFAELDENKSDEYLFTIEKDGIKKSFSDIKAGDVLSIFESGNKKGIKFIRVVISEKSVVGELTAKTTQEDKVWVKIGEEEYRAAKYFLDNFQTLPTGTSGRFLLNFAGEAVAFGQNAGRINVYGYLMDAGIKNSVSSSAEFKILTEEGDIEIFSASKRLNVDGKNYNSSSEQRSLVSGNELKKDGKFFQIIRYKKDADGFIKEIDTIKSGARTADELKEAFPALQRYYYSLSFGADKFDFGIDASKTAVFTVPKSEAFLNDDDKYFANQGSSPFKDGNKYLVTAYDIDDDLVAAAVLINADVDKNAGNSRRAVIVDKISTVTGDLVKLTGFQNGNYIIRYAEESDLQKRLRSFKQGDVITITDNMNSEILYARKLFTPSLNLDIDTYDPQNPEDPSFDDEQANTNVTPGNYDNIIYIGSNSDDLQNQFRGQYSALLRKNGNRIVLSGMNDDGSVNVDDTSKMSSVYVDANVSVTVYKRAEKSVQAGKLADLDKYIYAKNSDARIFIHTYVGVPRDIIVFDLSE